MNELLTIILATSTTLLAFFSWRFFKEARSLRSRYSVIIDIESELATVGAKLDQARRNKQQFESEDGERRTKLSQEYEKALVTYKELQAETSVLEESLEDMSFGLYKPHFDFQTAEEYKTALENLRDKERQVIRSGEAVICRIPWTVNNSRREGERMTRQESKLMLRAFNGECEAALSDVAWNNITKMEERVRRSFEAVNKLGSVSQISVTPEYMALRIDEIRLKHDYEGKRYQEREELRGIRERMREEEKARREIEEAREEAEAEEARFQKALERARAEAAKATGAQLERLSEQIASIESKLDQARRNKERAISRAELTKSGFVYVISNVGSFGERVYKIGMTRRMEPMDRIYELSGASVPFPFDLHVMLYSDNAPDLETALHHLFEERRLNLVNARKEFYREVELDEIETFVRTRGLSAQFIKHPEAREFRETLAVREQKRASVAPTEPGKFSDHLFGAAISSI